MLLPAPQRLTRFFAPSHTLSDTPLTPHPLTLTLSHAHPGVDDARGIRQRDAADHLDDGKTPKSTT